MKNFVTTLSFLLFVGLMSFGQSTNPLITACIAKAGSDTKYLKDFRIELGKTTEETDLRYKANMSLWKDMKYRFTMCSTDDSKGQLILKVKDEADKVVLSSYDQKTGKAYAQVDFICNKSGIYQLSYDFTNEEQGSGVGVISIVK
jgi:hypothetical protein